MVNKIHGLAYNKEGQTVHPLEFAFPRFLIPSGMREALAVAVEKGLMKANLVIVH
jgi:hypothetical protein